MSGEKDLMSEVELLDKNNKKVDDMSEEINLQVDHQVEADDDGQIKDDSIKLGVATEPITSSQNNILWRSRLITVLKFLSGPVIATPFFFDILDPGRIQVSRCAAVTIWMGLWYIQYDFFLTLNRWLLEPVPMACTCLLPTILFPITGLLSATSVSTAYFGDLTFLFMGSYIMAIALERWMLHKRFALIVLRILGTRPKLILFGFMVLSWFISQWLSNSATAAMLLPMAVAILSSIQGSNEGGEQNRPHLTMDAFAKSLLLGIAYASSIGGFATLTGTGTNLMLAAQLQILFPRSEGVITYLSWYLFSMPMSIVMIVILYLYFLIFIRKYEFPVSLSSEEGGEAVIDQHSQERRIRDMFKEEYKQLGPWKSEHVIVLILFILMALLWVTREIPISANEHVGWPDLLFWGSSSERKSFVTDGTVAMVITCLLFILPSRSTGGRMIDWSTVHDKMPWSVVLLLGSGFALSKAFSASHFADFISKVVGQHSALLHPFLLLLVLCFAVSILTEFTSNITTNSILLPVLANLAVSPAVNQNPLFLMVPATIACSLAFMTPIGTPPNALAYAYGYLRTRDMVVTGAFLNFIGVIVVCVWTFLLGDPILGIEQGKIPSWAMPSNSTRS